MTGARLPSFKPLSPNFKPLIRVMGFDDGYFRPRARAPGRTCLVGVFYRLDARVEGVVRTDIRVDGVDAGKKIVRLLRPSKFFPQVAAVLLQGRNFAGFNVVDLPWLSRQLGRPVIAVFRKQPNLKRIKTALSH